MNNEHNDSQQNITTSQMNNPKPAAQPALPPASGVGQITMDQMINKYPPINKPK